MRGGLSIVVAMMVTAAGGCADPPPPRAKRPAKEQAATTSAPSPAAPAPARPSVPPETSVTLVSTKQVEVAKDACAAMSMKDCETACANGDLAMCTVVGDLYTRGERVAKDVARGITFHEKACDGGQLMGCFSIGVQRRFTKAALAVTAFKKACDQGLLVACDQLVDMSDGKQGDLPRADLVQILKRLCAA